MISLFHKANNTFLFSNFHFSLLLKISPFSHKRCCLKLSDQPTIYNMKSFSFSTKINNNKNGEIKQNGKKNKIKTIDLKEFNEIKKQYMEQLKKTDDYKKKFEQMRKIYLDSVSEIENIKKRQKREIQNVKEFAISKFAKDLLEVHDNFSRAMSTINDMSDLEVDKEKMFHSLIEGIKMVNQSLTKIFNKNGVNEFTPKEKDKFDPSKHEAVYEYIDKEKTPGTIGKVLYSGFTLGSRILRPAKVGVVKK